jgi:hypothetical protein
MKKIILSLAIVGIVGAIAVGGTIAYFSDTATITGNTFTSGTLDLQIDSDASSSNYAWSDGFSNPTPFSNLYPGFTDEQIIDIWNAGSVDGYATIDLNRTSSWSDLAGVLNFRVYYDGNHDGTFEDTGLNGTVDQFTHAYNLGAITSENKIASVKIVWLVPTSAGNGIQGDSVTIDAVFGLEQNRAQ